MLDLPHSYNTRLKYCDIHECNNNKYNTVTVHYRQYTYKVKHVSLKLIERNKCGSTRHRGSWLYLLPFTNKVNIIKNIHIIFDKLSILVDCRFFSISLSLNFL